MVFNFLFFNFIVNFIAKLEDLLIDLEQKYFSTKFLAVIDLIKFPLDSSFLM